MKANPLFFRVLSRRLFSATSAGDVSIEYPAPGIAHMILNRHDGKNSFSKKFRDEIIEAVKTVSVDKKLNVLVIKSLVPKVFCAGADLKERRTMSEKEVVEFVDSLRSTMDLIERIPFPTIAAIEGAALGGGLELALACDFRVAGSDAILGLPETSLAIVPGAGGTQRLPRVVGVPKAKELIFTAKRLKGHDAAAIGLVTECVPSGTAIARAHELALDIAEKGPVALRMAKKAICEGSSLEMSKALEIEKSCYAAVLPTKDRLEGLKAFAEKRKPVYLGE